MKKKRISLWYVWFMIVPIFTYFVWIGGDYSFENSFFVTVLYTSFISGAFCLLVKGYRVYKDSVFKNPHTIHSKQL